jgi:hypothetical protein
MISKGCPEAEAELKNDKPSMSCSRSIQYKECHISEDPDRII